MHIISYVVKMTAICAPHNIVISNHVTTLYMISTKTGQLNSSCSFSYDLNEGHHFIVTVNSMIQQNCLESFYGSGLHPLSILLILIRLIEIFRCQIIFDNFSHTKFLTSFSGCDLCDP